jgi:hypothetical protein
MTADNREMYQEVLQIANQMYSSGPDWITFFREVLGVEGVIRRSFPDSALLRAFEQSPEHEEIQQMLVRLWAQGGGAAVDDQEPTRVITVRLPQSLHDALRAEAHDLHTSINKLCISKLLQVIDGNLVPAGATKPATAGTRKRREVEEIAEREITAKAG